MSVSAQAPAKSTDPRHIESGNLIPKKNYCDQPYVVITKDGNWLCVLTTGEGHEGSGGQHIVATISEDQGKTWSPLIDIEPSSGPEASWVVPLIVPSGRVYVFYTYNGDALRSLPGSNGKIRADMLGWYCFKYSDDNGKTWSNKRYRIPVRTTAADRGNQWKGKVNIFWGIDKPKVSEMGVTFAFTKLGRYMLDNGEGWMMHSDNILTEADPEKINWSTLPEGEHGLRMPQYGSIQEEHNHVIIGPGEMYLVYRTQTGYPCHTYSRDGAKTWTDPVHMTYSPNGRRVKNQRACPKLFKCENGKYLLWFHNHSRKSFFYRNPVWIAGGVVRDGKMHWSEPEILLYHNDLPADDLQFNGSPMRLRGSSYPDLIEQDGKYWITETKKTVARVHEIDPTLLEGMWAQLEDKGTLTKKGLALSMDQPVSKPTEVKMPPLPDLGTLGSGFALDLRLEFQDLEAGQVILDSRDQNGKGLALSVEDTGALRLRFSDGQNPSAQWTSDPGLLKPGHVHHITAIADGGPNIITFLIDGKLCDGDEQRIRGWGRFDLTIGDINGSTTLQIAPAMRGTIHHLRIYDRYLRTSEAVANYQADVADNLNASDKRSTREGVSKQAAFDLWAGPEISSDVTKIPFVEGIQHRTIHDARQSDYKFLHGAAIISYKGTFFAHWANSPKDENYPRETLQGRRTNDPLGDWSAVEVIGPGFSGPERHSHGVFLEHKGQLWTIAARFGVGAKGDRFDGLKAEAFMLNEQTDKWESKGIVMENCWPYDQPVLMDNGNNVTGGQDKDGLPVIAISHGDDVTNWTSVPLPYPPELEPRFAETTVWAEGKRVLAVIRGGGGVAWVSTSDDYGKTWRKAMPSNHPMPRSKAFLGKLSTGQLYLISNLRDRNTLVISVGQPGEMTLSSMWRIRHGKSGPPRFPGRAKSKQWSYPYGYEHDGQLYVVYSIGKEDCGLSVMPIESLAARHPETR